MKKKILKVVVSVMFALIGVMFLNVSKGYAKTVTIYLASDSSPKNIYATIKYDGDAKIYIESVTYSDGTVVYNPSDVICPKTPDNYTFQGFEGRGINAAGMIQREIFDYSDGAVISPIFSPNVYRIMLDTNDPPGSCEAPIYEKYGVGFFTDDICTIPYSPVPRGTSLDRVHVFLKYVDGKNNEIIDSNGEIKVGYDYFNNDETIVAVWEPKVFKVDIYITDGDTIEKTPVKTIYAKYGVGGFSNKEATDPIDKIDLGPIEKKYHVFSGCFLNRLSWPPEYIDKNGFLTEKIKDIDSDCDIYAIVKKTTNIIFLYEGLPGVGMTRTVKVVAGELMDSSNNPAETLIPMRKPSDGYVFGGYYSEEDGKGIRYIKPDGYIEDKDALAIYKGNLYVYWKPKVSRLSFYEDEGSSKPFIELYVKYTEDVLYKEKECVTIVDKNNIVIERDTAVFDGYFYYTPDKGKRQMRADSMGFSYIDEDTNYYVAWIEKRVQIVVDERSTDGNPIRPCYVFSASKLCDNQGNIKKMYVPPDRETGENPYFEGYYDVNTQLQCITREGNPTQHLYDIVFDMCVDKSISITPLGSGSSGMGFLPVTLLGDRVASLGTSLTLVAHWTNKLPVVTPATDPTYNYSGYGGSGGSGGGGRYFDGWVKDNKDDWYYYRNGATIGGWYFEQEDGQWYYLDPVTHIMQMGYHVIDNKLYYFSQRNADSINWQKVGNRYICLGKKTKSLGSLYVKCDVVPGLLGADKDGVICDYGTDFGGKAQKIGFDKGKYRLYDGNGNAMIKYIEYENNLYYDPMDGVLYGDLAYKNCIFRFRSDGKLVSPEDVITVRRESII